MFICENLCYDQGTKESNGDICLTNDKTVF